MPTDIIRELASGFPVASTLNEVWFWLENTDLGTELTRAVTNCLSLTISYLDGLLPAIVGWCMAFYIFEKP